jgi:hypothetical protein
LRFSRLPLSALVATLLAPALVSCVWILDFDELQTEEDKGAGAGSSGKGGTDSGGGTGGSSGTAGEGGSGDCPSQCFDNDPCTLDGCTANGECTREPVTGLALDGVDETIPADTTYRVTMAPGPDAFFLSSYTIDGVNPEVAFYRLDANAPTDALTKIADLGGLNLGDATPISAAGLAVDNALGRIHAFIGMGNDAGARLWHVVLDMNYEVVSRTIVLTGYGEQTPYNYPVVANLGGEIAATWINGSQNVSLWTGKLAGPSEVAVGRTPMTVALIATDANDPLALYGVDGGGVFVEGSGFPAVGMDECQVNPGGYLSAASVSTGIPGFWIGYWTKYALPGDEGYLTTDARGIGCGASGCASAPATDCGSAANNLVRNVAVAGAVRPGDPTGVVHMIQVTPLIGTEDNGATLSAGLLANASRIDFGDVPFQGETMTTDLGSVPLAAMPTTLPNLEGPDWPAVAYVPPNRIAIAWTQPAPTTGSEVRIQRYRLCAPD